MKHRQTLSPRESRSQHEKVYDPCLKAQHVIDIQVYAMRDNNLTLITCLSLAGLLRKILCECHQSLLWLLMTGGSLCGCGRRTQDEKAFSCTPSENTLWKVKNVIESPHSHLKNKLQSLSYSFFSFMSKKM